MPAYERYSASSPRNVNTGSDFHNRSDRKDETAGMVSFCISDASEFSPEAHAFHGQMNTIS